MICRKLVFVVLTLGYTLTTLKAQDVSVHSESVSALAPQQIAVHFDSADLEGIIVTLESLVEEAITESENEWSLKPSAESHDAVETPESTSENEIESLMVTSPSVASVSPSPSTSISSSRDTESLAVATSPIASVSPSPTTSTPLSEKYGRKQPRPVPHAVAPSAEVEAIEETEETAEGNNDAERVGSTEYSKVKVSSSPEPNFVAEVSQAPHVSSEHPTPTKKSPVLKASPSTEMSELTQTSEAPKDSPEPSPKHSPSASSSPAKVPLRTLVYGRKGYSDSVVLMLADSEEVAEDMETFVEQLRDAGFVRSKFIAVQADEVWIRKDGKKKIAWYDGSKEAEGSVREAQMLRATERVMELAHGRRPIIVGFGQGGTVALTAYMRYGVDGVVSSCGGLGLLSSYPREMTNDSEGSMALVIGGDHVQSGVERMQSAGREVVFLRTNQPKENGRFKDEVIGYVIGVLNRAIAT